MPNFCAWVTFLGFFVGNLTLSKGRDKGDIEKERFFLLYSMTFRAHHLHRWTHSTRGSFTVIPLIGQSVLIKYYSLNVWFLIPRQELNIDFLVSIYKNCVKFRLTHYC